MTPMQVTDEVVLKWSGFLYLSLVLAAFSRCIIRRAMDSCLHTKLVLDGLDMALWQRYPRHVIHHSDQ